MDDYLNDDDFITEEIGLEVNFITFKSDLSKLINKLKKSVKQTSETEKLFKQINDLLDWYC